MIIEPQALIPMHYFSYVTCVELVIAHRAVDSLLKFVTKFDQLHIFVEETAVLQSASPCVDSGDRIRGSFLLLLILSVMSNDGAMVRLCHDCSALTNELVIHQSLRIITTCYDFSENIAVIIL